MDYQEYVDGFELTTCIISVERFTDGSYGNIRIVAGNKAYIDSIENPYNSASSHMLNNKFVPGSPYEKYIPKDLNFEQTCYRCAFEKKPVHTYLKPERFNCWINQYIMPLHSDEENIGYCSYTLDVTMEADSSIMTGVSASTASSVLETCIKLRQNGDFISAVKDVISGIREYCGAYTCSLLLTDFKQNACRTIAESVRGVPEDKIRSVYNDDEFFDVVKTWSGTIDGSNCLILEDQDMKVLKERNPVWYESLMKLEVKSIALFPLIHNDETLGYIWATNFDPSKTQKIKETLELTTYFIASEIANYQLFRRMEVLSTYDALTGVYNRNAMNKRVDSYVSGERKVPQRYAVIFADVNGLKHINDIYGHGSGDAMLKEATEKLRTEFGDGDLFRAGGDEFVIILPDVSETEVEARIDKLRKDSEDPKNISFAVGGYYVDNGGDIRYAMRVADERMYADKERYYAKFPDRRRRQ
ncbi:MAG: diguanylate cyclase [Oscillospiraceae bacterium]|nr:diguanylate cyclase [Oscillospiraceae bacterium]